MKRSHVVLILAVVVLLRLAFLNQPVQGDDVYYLYGAQHAQIDPLHPTHARYAFQGTLVDMRGHPHGPFNSWYLALLLWLTGTVNETVYHAAYIPFSLIAALSAYAIAARFGRRPLIATLLFVATLTFIVNGNSLEADLPFVAFWLLAVTCFVYERWWICALAAALAALTAYQAIVLVPVLAWYLIVSKKYRSWAAWVAVLAAPACILAWQVYERLTSGALPATVLVGYMQSYNLQAAAQKLKSAAALTGHTGWLVFPVLPVLAFWRSPLWVRIGAGAVMAAGIAADPNPLFWLSFGVGALVILWCVNAIRHADPNVRFLAGWVAVFFAAALVIFFAGSARYLLPIVVPVAILVSDRLTPRVLAIGIAAEAAIGLGLALVNYQHWAGYRDFARTIESDVNAHRTWTDAEWGLRYYLVNEGARPVLNSRTFWTNDLIVTSEYAAAHRPGPAAVIAQREITSPIPLRIVAPGADSAYSSVGFGLAPFAISLRPMDHVRALLVAGRKAEQSMLEIGTPAAAAQIVSGVYNADHWTAGRATVLLKRPAGDTRLIAKIFIPPQAAARTVSLYMDGELLARETYPGSGAYTLSAAAPDAGIATVTLEVDRTFSVPPDMRALGVVLLSIGFDSGSR